MSGFWPFLGHCVVFLGKTLYSHSASLHPGAEKGVLIMQKRYIDSGYTMDFSLLFTVGADLANLVNAAAIYAASEGDASVTTHHLEFARDKIIMGKFDFVFLSSSFACRVLLFY